MDSRKSIVANYDGRMRILSPYELGWKNGNLRCLFYQSGGGSNSGFIRSGSKNNWRCLDLYKLTNIRISDESIQAPIIKPRRGYIIVSIHVLKKSIFKTGFPFFFLNYSKIKDLPYSSLLVKNPELEISQD